MGQAIGETLFDILYLGIIITVGFIMFLKSKDRILVKNFGIMAIILGCGDAFHLVPRIIALWGSGLEANAIPLGIGKLITSITMTIFYLILYYIWRERYKIKGQTGLTVTLWILAILRIAICLLPQNHWVQYNPPLFWGVLRNIPFTIMGIIIIIIFAQQIKKQHDEIFKYMPLAITLSFLFYIPVVLFAERIPLIGMLMIPKTLAYVWIVSMGWKLYKQPQTD